MKKLFKNKIAFTLFTVLIVIPMLVYCFVSMYNYSGYPYSLDNDIICLCYGIAMTALIGSWFGYLLLISE